MGFLGLDWLESKQTKKFKDDAYLHLIYPYGRKQEEKISSLLSSLFEGVILSELKYNYIVTKQKLTNVDFYKLSAKEQHDLIEDLKDHFINNNVDVKLFLSLALIDLNIKEDLNYPSPDQIKKYSLNNNVNTF